MHVGGTGRLLSLGHERGHLFHDRRLRPLGRALEVDSASLGALLLLLLVRRVVHLCARPVDHAAEPLLLHLERIDTRRDDPGARIEHHRPLLEDLDGTAGGVAVHVADHPVHVVDVVRIQEGILLVHLVVHEALHRVAVTLQASLLATWRFLER